MIAAGLARAAEDGRPMRDFFFNRVMFPISDGRGRLIAFGARALEADAKPKYINTGETPLFSKGTQLYNFATARAAAIKAGTIILAEGYMDVIALVRAGFAHSVAPLGTALTEDQLHLLWRTAPEPILAFDGDAAGLEGRAPRRPSGAAASEARLFAALCLPALGRGPRQLHRRQWRGRDERCCWRPRLPLSQLLWRAETEGKDLSTPERRAGLEHNLKEITDRITDAKVADYYRRGFDQLVFENFKRRSPAAKGRPRPRPARVGQDRRFRGDFKPRPCRARPRRSRPVSRPRALVRSGQAGARHAKEMELGRAPGGSPRNRPVGGGNCWPVLDLADPSLDRLRHELLNLAASGSSLEKAGVQTHLSRKGMADLLARFAGPAVEDPLSSFQRAVLDLRELAGQQTDARRLLERRKQRFDRPNDGRGH